MLIIPVAQEDSTVRRTPWVSLVLIALNAIVFGLSPLLFDSRTTEAEIERLAQGAAATLYRSPYLRVPAALEPYLTDKFEAELNARRERVRLPKRDVQEAEQKELDDLGRQLRTATEALPAQRFGFIPATAERSRA